MTHTFPKPYEIPNAVWTFRLIGPRNLLEMLDYHPTLSRAIPVTHKSRLYSFGAKERSSKLSMQRSLQPRSSDHLHGVIS
jgi:hypothetical protein